MFAAAFHAHLDLASTESLCKGFSLAMSKLCQFAGTCKTHGAGKGTIHRGSRRAGTLRVGENV